MGDGVDLLGKHGAELIVKGICFILIVCDCLAICCQCRMSMHSRLFALLNDQNCVGFVFRLSPMWLFR